MKKLVVLILLMIFAFVSGTNSQTFFGEIWGNGGFALSLPKLYTLDIGEEYEDGKIKNYILNRNTTGAFGLFAGLKVKLFEINENVYFGPSVYFQKILAVHNVKFTTAFDLGLNLEEHWRPIANFPDEEFHSFGEPYPEIDDSETKIGLNLFAKIKIVQNLFLEGRFEFVSGLNQFRLTASYKLWERKKFEEEY